MPVAEDGRRMSRNEVRERSLTGSPAGTSKLQCINSPTVFQVNVAVSMAELDRPIIDLIDGQPTEEVSKKLLNLTTPIINKHCELIPRYLSFSFYFADTLKDRPARDTVEFERDGKGQWNPVPGRRPGGAEAAKLTKRYEIENGYQWVALIGSPSLEPMVQGSFSQFPKGGYLNAVALGDLAKLRAFDAELLRPMQPMMNEYINVLERTVGVLGGAKLVEEAKRRLKNASLLPAVLTTYLFHYDRNFSKCLDAASTVSRQVRRFRPDRVWVNGRDEEVFRLMGYDETKTYNIKKSFQPIFSHLVPTGLGQDEGPKAPSFLQRAGGADGVQVLLNTTLRAMSTFSCDSNEIAELERGFLKLYWELPR